MEVIVFLIITIVFVLLMRLVGAWMLRINEVINRLEDIVKLLKDRNNETKA